MLVLPGRVVRPFLSALRRCAAARTRAAPPAVLIRHGPGGLSLTAARGGVVLRWQRAEPGPPAAVAVTADHLAAGGGADLTITPTGSAELEFRWRAGTKTGSWRSRSLTRPPSPRSRPRPYALPTTTGPWY